MVGHGDCDSPCAVVGVEGVRLAHLAARQRYSLRAVEPPSDGEPAHNEVIYLSVKRAPVAEPDDFFSPSPILNLGVGDGPDGLGVSGHSLVPRGYDGCFAHAPLHWRVRRRLAEGE